MFCILIFFLCSMFSTPLSLRVINIWLLSSLLYQIQAARWGDLRIWSFQTVQTSWLNTNFSQEGKYKPSKENLDNMEILSLHTTVYKCKILVKQGKFSCNIFMYVNIIFKANLCQFRAKECFCGYFANELSQNCSFGSTWFQIAPR